MKKGILTISLGLLAGLIAQNIYYKSFKPCDDNTLECQLSWIQDYLSLTPDQYKLVVALHRDQQPEILALEKRVQDLESQIAALEEERIENDRIDFIAFYGYLQEKVSLDKTREHSTDSFLAKVGSIMSSEQQARFNEMLRTYNISDSQGS